VPLILAVAIFVVTLSIIIRCIVPIGGIVALQANSQVHLPVAKSNPSPPDPATTLRMLVKADGTVFVDNQPVPDAAIDRLLNERAPEKVLLRADRRLHYNRLKSLMVKIGDHGAKMAFSVVENADLPELPPAPATPATADPSSRAENK
jgi:biopolymer transport protein ExbD